MISKYSHLTSDHTVSLTCTAQSIQVMADRELLSLAIRRLVENAFKYSPAGSSVAVGLNVDNDAVHIRVQNDGSSIAPQEHDRIFERFYRGAEVRNGVSGVGLGLYVARKIAVAHGGSLELESGHGSGKVIFRLSLSPSLPPQNMPDEYLHD
jgi:signal transduction histidine kinase